MTHTYAELEVSAEAFDEIAEKLRGAGYDHAFVGDGWTPPTKVDMHGIALMCGPSSARLKHPSALQKHQIEIDADAFDEIREYVERHDPKIPTSQESVDMGRFVLKPRARGKKGTSPKNPEEYTLTDLAEIISSITIRPRESLETVGGFELKDGKSTFIPGTRYSFGEPKIETSDKRVTIEYGTRLWAHFMLRDGKKIRHSTWSPGTYWVLRDDCMRVRDRRFEGDSDATSELHRLWTQTENWELYEEDKDTVETPDTADAKFGSASCTLDGDTDYVRVDDPAQTRRAIGLGEDITEWKEPEDVGVHTVGDIVDGLDRAKKDRDLVVLMAGSVSWAMEALRRGKRIRKRGCQSAGKITSGTGKAVSRQSCGPAQPKGVARSATSTSQSGSRFSTTPTGRKSSTNPRPSRTSSTKTVNPR